MTKREAILAAAASQIDATNPIGSAVFRNRMDGFARGESIAVVVRPVSDNPQFTVIGPIDSTFTFAVDVMIMAAESGIQNTADDVAEAAYAALMAGIPGTMDITPGPHTWDFEGGDLAAMILTMEFNAFYRHSWGSLAT